MSGKWGGDDAINVMLTPESIILNQNLTTKQIDLSQAYADVSVIKGSESLAGFTCTIGTGAEAPVHCNASVNGNRITITGIHSNSGQYYDNGSVTIKVSYNGNTYTKVFRFYANLLGTWKETVENDTRTAVAAMKYWVYDKDGSPVEQKNIAEFIQSSSINQSTIASTVGGMAGNGGNILAGSELFPVDTKLEHVSTQVDGVIEYPQGSSPAIYSAVQLVAGKTYILQIKSDGTLASAHDSPTQQGKYTVWLRINGTLDGEPYNGHCFTWANHTGILDDGALWWRFECRLTGTYWLRTNTYSDGTTPVTVHFWDLMLEQSTIPSGWSAPSSRILSQIKQTASAIELSVITKLGETGIKIDGNNRKIELRGDKVKFLNNAGTVDDKIWIDPTTGALHAKNGFFTNGAFQYGSFQFGSFDSIRTSKFFSPWYDIMSPTDKSFDNIYCSRNGQTLKIDTGVGQVGRIIRICASGLGNFNTHNSITLTLQGNDIDADTGLPINEEYFFFRSTKETSLSITAAMVELLGIGTETKFLGWVVLNIQSLPSSEGGDAGLNLKALFKGFVRYNGTIEYYAACSNRYTLSCVKQDTGKYRIFLPASLNDSRAAQLRIHTESSGSNDVLTFHSYIDANDSTHLLQPYFDVRTKLGTDYVDSNFDFIIYNNDTFF